MRTTNTVAHAARTTCLRIGSLTTLLILVAVLRNQFTITIIVTVLILGAFGRHCGATRHQIPRRVTPIKDITHHEIPHTLHAHTAFHAVAQTVAVAIRTVVAGSLAAGQQASSAATLGTA